MFAQVVDGAQDQVQEHQRTAARKDDVQETEGDLHDGRHLHSRGPDEPNPLPCHEHQEYPHEHRSRMFDCPGEAVREDDQSEVHVQVGLLPHGNSGPNEDRINEEDSHIDDVMDDMTFVESTEDGEALPRGDVTKKLREDLKLCRKEKEEYLTGWQRAKADYVNLQKDEENKRREMRNFVTVDIIEQLLPVLDSFDMAFSNKEAWEKVDVNWRNGIEYIRAQFSRVLEDNNVVAINQTGVPFDHNIHEAIETIETKEELQDHTVAKIIQSGYKIGDKIIRPARVHVFEYKK